MKNKNIGNYAKRAIDAVFSSLADSVGNFVYDSALKAPYQIRHDIVYGVDGKSNASGHVIPSLEGSVKERFSDKLEKRAEKAICKLNEALKAGEISEAHYNQTLFSEMKNLQEEFRVRNDVYRKNFLPFAEHDILKGTAVPEPDRKLGGVRAAGMGEFLENNAAEASIIPSKPTPPKIEHSNETYMEKQAYKAMRMLAGGFSYVGKEADKTFGAIEDVLFWIGHQMYKHPIATITVAAPIAVGAVYKTNTDFQKWVDDGASKTKTGVAGGAAGFFGDIGGLFKENQPPVADFEIKGNLTAGSPIEILDKSYDPDGKIVKSELRVDGVDGWVTSVPTMLSQGEHTISLRVTDDGGKSAVKSERMEVKPYQFTPDIEVHGSNSYKQKVQEKLKDLDTTPNFKIRGMTARQYVEKYMDYLYEAVPGTRENCPPEAIGKQATVCLDEKSIDASTLLHVTRHIDQEIGELKEDFKNKKTYEYEKDAVDIQSKWLAARNNMSEEQRQNWFDNAMKYYDPRY